MLRERDPNFIYRDQERVIVDVPRAKRSGAREVEVSYDEVAGNIRVEVRKSRKAPPQSHEGGS